MLKNTNRLELCKKIQLRTISDKRGDLTFVEEQIDIPFTAKRMYYLHNLQKGVKRGGHAHKNLQQLLIPLNGSFVIKLTDGFDAQKHILNNATEGLLIVPMVWRDIDVLESKAILACLASDIYDESDYIRDYEEFTKKSGK